MGERTFNKIQAGIESSRGTAVAATRHLPGSLTVPTDRKPKFPEENLALRARSQRSAIYQLLADNVRYSLTDGVFQVLPLLFSIGLKGGVTGAEQTTDQDDYLYDFSPSLTGDNDPVAMTLEYGDNTQAYEIEYTMAKRIRIAGNPGSDAAVTIDADLFGRQITPVSFTGAIATPLYTEMVANMAKFYIDGTWATLGNTQKTGLLREFSVEILTGVHYKFHGNGAKYFSTHGESLIDVMATFTFEGDSTADTEFDAFQAGTPRAIRLLIEGPQIGSGDKHALQLDMYGSYEEVIPLGGNEDGDNLHTAIFHVHADRESTRHMLGVQVTTNISAAA